MKTKHPENTIEYIKENKKIEDLETLIAKNPGYRVNNSKSLLLRFFKNSKNYLRFIYSLIKYKSEIHNLYKQKNSKLNESAIVVGNGPTQGYLSVDFLQAFKQSGGEIFAVNFWNENKRLSAIAPDYLVISDPYTLNFSINDERSDFIKIKNQLLKEYLENINDIKIICPLDNVHRMKNMFPKHRIIGFVDYEVSCFNNIAPIFPRSYNSMTLYKALAISVWLNYKKIYIIGMDNTYIKDIYCNKENHILRLERHAGGENYLQDISALYSSIGDLVIKMGESFKHLEKFSNSKNIFNLDPYSLVDAFPKVEIEGLNTQFSSEKRKNLHDVKH